MNRKFPILEDRDFKEIDWEIAELAYRDYGDGLNSSQSLETIAKRGGFSAYEIIRHLYRLMKKEGIA